MTVGIPAELRGDVSLALTRCAENLEKHE
jgi:hypothetical protein